MRDGSAHVHAAARQERDAATRAFVVLLRGQHEAARVASLLCEIGLDNAVVVVPPVRGLAFFADPCGELDEWWGEAVPRHAEPVYVLGNEPGLTQWTASVDGLFLVGVDEPADVTAFAGHARIRAFNVTDAVDYVITVAREFGGIAASIEAASLLGQRLPRRDGEPPRPRPTTPRFRRARLDAATELMVAVPSPARAVAPRQLLVTVDDDASVRGSEAFFTPSKPLQRADSRCESEAATAVAS